MHVKQQGAVVSIKIKRTRLTGGASLMDAIELRVKAFKGRRCGHGLYADVYGSTSRDRKSVVMKVGTTSRVDSDAYFDYVKSVVLKQPSNPLVPKIEAVEIITSSSGCEQAYVVVMERLLKWDDIPMMHRDKGLEACGLLDIYQFDTTRNTHEDLKESLEYDTTGGLRPLVRSLRRVMDRHHPDLHYGNVMWRKTRSRRVPYQLVLTDPVV